MEIFKHRLNKLISYDPVKFEEVSATNIHRMHVMAWLMGFINIVHIVIFWIHVPSEPAHVVKWYYLIIIVHSIMLIVNSALGLIAYKLEKGANQTAKLAYVIQGISIIANLFFGILLCVSDQLVTSNINPLLTACIGVGVLFLIPPIMAIVVYSIVFAVFINLVPLTQQVPELLEHVRINSVTAVGMGFGVSWVLWRNQLLRIEQKRIIDDQQRKLEEKNQYLEFLATHDPLTGLYNRAHIVELADRIIINSRMEKREACLLLLDIDFFKTINDTYGHPAGDQLLKDISMIVSNSIRTSDIAARLGGEEFIILLPETDQDAGYQVAESLRMQIQDYHFTYEGQILRVTASFGMARLVDSFSTSYSEADVALYSAKKTGRNRVSITSIVSVAES